MPHTRIPRIIYQTTHMPLYIVPDLLGEHARGFERHIFNDSQARSFLHDHIGENASMAYDVLPGAHKADLWRYAILYVRGGIYLDIKTISAAPLADIFPEHNELPTLYTVRSARGWVHNGIIAAPPKHSIMKGLLDHMLRHSIQAAVTSYFCSHFMLTLSHFFGKEVGAAAAGSSGYGHGGVFVHGSERLVLYDERCSKSGHSRHSKECQRISNGWRDRYGRCCNIYQGGPWNVSELMNDSMHEHVLFHTRDPGYPSKWLSKLNHTRNASAQFQLLAPGDSGQQDTSDNYVSSIVVRAQ